MSIVVNSLQSVTVDEQPAGSLVDALLNCRDRSAEINDALMAWEERQQVAFQDQLAAAVTSALAQQDQVHQSQLQQAVADAQQSLVNQFAAQINATNAAALLDRQTKDAWQRVACAHQALSTILMQGTAEQAVAAVTAVQRSALDLEELETSAKATALAARRAALGGP